MKLLLINSIAYKKDKMHSNLIYIKCIITLTFYGYLVRDFDYCFSSKILDIYT